ncbi:unnamed protein product [Microthlaspi erraticum]|uniref:Aspartic peptidase DDI1-type domain-containing protein n=1 Tax=Microthlaspi erraticum TaxID=1685480 RepID=A0A6D2KWQ4_9BRAS|nr:unnamed protein product [Microthlaspi erraticum]
MKAMIFGQTQDHVSLRRAPYYQEIIGDFAWEQSQEVNYLDDFIHPPDFQQQSPRFHHQGSQFQPMQQYNQEGMYPMKQPYNFPPSAPHPVQQNSVIQAMLQQIVDDQKEITNELDERMESFFNSFIDNNECKLDYKMKAMIFGQTQDHVSLRRAPYYQEIIGDFAWEQSQEVNYLDDFIHPPDFQQQSPRFHHQGSQFQPMPQYNQEGMYPMKQPYNFPPSAPHPVQQNSVIQAMLQQIVDDQKEITNELDERMESFFNSFIDKNESLACQIKKIHTHIDRTYEDLKRQDMEETKAFCESISIREAEFVPTHKPPQTAVNLATRPEQEHYSLDSTRGYKPKPLEKISNPEKLGLPCIINGVLFKDSICDTRSHINIMNKGIAKKIGIEVRDPSKTPMRFKDDPYTLFHGFISDLTLSIGDHVFKADLQILEMKHDPDKPLSFGSSFLEANGAILDLQKQRISLSKIKPNNDQEELIDVISAAPLIIPKEIAIPAKANCIKVSSVLSKILTPREYKEDVIDATPQPIRTSRCFSKFSFDFQNKENKEPFKDGLHKKRKLFTGGIVSCNYIQDLQDVHRRSFKPSGPECREAKGASTLLFDQLVN